MLLTHFRCEMSRIKINVSRTRKKEVSKKNLFDPVFVTRPGTGVASERSSSSPSRWPAPSASSSTQSATLTASRCLTKNDAATCLTCLVRRYSSSVRFGYFAWWLSSSPIGNSNPTATMSTSGGCSLSRFSLSLQSCLAGSSSHYESRPSTPTER